MSWAGAAPGISSSGRGTSTSHLESKLSWHLDHDCNISVSPLMVSDIKNTATEKVPLVMYSGIFAPQSLSSKASLAFSNVFIFCLLHLYLIMQWQKLFTQTYHFIFYPRHIVSQWNERQNVCVVLPYNYQTLLNNGKDTTNLRPESFDYNESTGCCCTFTSQLMIACPRLFSWQ